MCQRLTDREMQILYVAVRFASMYGEIKRVSYSYEDIIRSVQSLLPFEVSEEDVKILCGPMMVEGKQ